MAFMNFFNTPSHRAFHYEPRYYDERRERREKVAKNAQMEKAIREGRTWNDPDYKPGSIIRDSSRNYNREDYWHKDKGGLMSIVKAVSLLILFGLIWYFFRNAAFLFSIM